MTKVLVPMLGRWGVLYFSICGLAFGQLVSSSETTTGSPISPGILTDSNTSAAILSQFEETQQTIGQGMEQLQDATSDQLAAWMTENQDLLLAQQTLAIQLGAFSSAQPLSYITEVTFPDDASPDLENFLTTQANLYNSDAQIYNGLLQEGTISSTQGVALVGQPAGSTIATQQQLAQTLGAEAEQQILPLPQPSIIPPGASATLQTFLTLRDQLMTAQIQLHNQNVNSSPAARDVALQLWLQQNAALSQQLQQLAQNLSSGSSD